MGTRGQTAHLKAAFLEAFRNLGQVTTACKASGASRSVIYKWRKCDPRFAAAFAEAEEDAICLLEEEARRRAVDGVTRVKPYFYKGVQCGEESITEYSDGLLIFLLKARRPEVYRENKQEIHHTGGPKPLEDLLTPEQLAILEGRLGFTPDDYIHPD